MHNGNDLPRPKSKIKNKDTSEDKSNTSNTKPNRTSPQTEDKIKDKEAKKEPDKKSPKKKSSSKRNKSLTANKATSLGSPVILSLVPLHKNLKTTLHKHVPGAILNDTLSEFYKITSELTETKVDDINSFKT